MTEAYAMKWRVGKEGRTVFAQVGKSPSSDDVLIGVMDTDVLARDVVNGHNATLPICPTCIKQARHPDNQGRYKDKSPGGTETWTCGHTIGK